MLQNTLKNLRARREGEEGFTLIELMVVVLIIAILIAIAIPTFLGAKSRAEDKQPQSNLRNAITAAKTVYADHQDYTEATSAALTEVEPSLTFQDENTASTEPKQVSVSTPDASTVIMASLSKSGTCWVAKDVQTAGAAGTQYGKVTGACTASNAATNGTFGDTF